MNDFLRMIIIWQDLWLKNMIR